MRSPHKPVHEIRDYFTRPEFTKRGCVHVHWFAYIRNVLQYGEVDSETVAGFCAKYYLVYLI